ncbi:membrane protein, partial [Candidatus Magnetomorum sp. HK-1]
MLKRLNITFFFRLTGLVLLIYIISKIGLNQLINCLLNVDPQYILFVLLINFLLIYSKTLRWNSILKLQQIYLPIKESYLIYYSG